MPADDVELSLADDVDRLLGDWRRERPDIDVSPMEVLSRVTRLSYLLDKTRGEAFALHGIVAWEFDVLAALRRTGPPYELSPGRLLRETHVTSGTMTNRVDRLTGRGLVSRSPDPTDRRGVVVRLTEAGRTVVDGALESLVAREQAMLDGLNAAQREQLSALLRSLMTRFA